MLLEIVILIMLFTGIVGGSVYWILPANTNENGTRIRPWWESILLGIGATLLIPLFLEIAQSNLLDDIHYNRWNILGSENIVNGNTGDTTKIAISIDTTKTAAKGKQPAGKAPKARVQPKRYLITNDEKLKNYLILAAYCFLAAAAGPRFINTIMDGVLKEKIAALTKEKEVATEEKNKAIEEKEKAVEEKEKISEEKVKIKKDKDWVVAQNRLSAQKLEESVLKSIILPTEIASGIPMPVIGPVVHVDDPQKGRFGGSSTSNDRALKATVKQVGKSEIFNITLWVESINADKPLDSDVIFYLHDTYQPSVYTIKPEEFIAGQAVYDDIIAYGAFTVGAVTDGGYTLLELDLAEQPEFPELFRSR